VFIGVMGCFVGVGTCLYVCVCLVCLFSFIVVCLVCFCCLRCFIAVIVLL